jgi:hypothetical protein
VSGATEKKSLLLLVFTFETMKKWEEGMIRCMGDRGSMVNRCELGGRECADGCMGCRTGKKDRERR